MYLIQFLAKKFQCNPQTTRPIARTIDSSTQTDNKVLLLKTTPRLIKYEEIKLVPTQRLHLSVLAVLIQAGTQYVTKGEM